MSDLSEIQMPSPELARRLGDLLCKAGTRYISGEMGFVDEAKACDHWKRAAAKGDVDAMLRLARRFQDNRNMWEACAWYRLAALQHQHTGAMVALGEIAERQDRASEAIEWYGMAAHTGEGDPVGMRKLGFVYLYGGFYEAPDFAAAYLWLGKSAHKGDAAAMRAFGELHCKGIGTVKDGAEACAWWEKAADAGDVKAMFNLGEAYREGRENVAKNIGKAAAYYKRAADAGHVAARILLAGVTAGQQAHHRELTERLLKVAGPAQKAPALSRPHANREALRRRAAFKVCSS